MKYFKLISPHGKMPDSNIWYGIDGDPTMKIEEYVFVKKPIPNFEQTWEIFYNVNDSNERLGCSSLFYFKYYNELKDKIYTIVNEKEQLNNNKKILILFITDYLNKWLIFIKRSDDILYPQNNVFREIAKLLKPHFSEFLSN